MIYKNALVSVSHKEGLVECVRFLFESGTRIVSTGGTAQVLEKAGIKTESVSQQTQFPEVMDGRVKTLHPHIHIPLLARLRNSQDEKELRSRNLEHFDLLICNLYPFDSVVASLSEKELIEFIDVGGPSLLRAGAKNFEKITVLCDPKDYSLLQSSQKPSVEVRKKLAGKVFSHLSVYDHSISKYLSGTSFENVHSTFSLGGRFFKSLRYGENPQQKAKWYHSSSEKGLHDASVIQGKELSFNNILDVQSAVNVLRDFSDACFVGVKHNNPCGVACAKSLEKAVQEGVKADPLSIFGGIVALNREVTLEVAKALSDIFLECIVAPSYSQEALDQFAQKKSLRVIAWKNILEHSHQFCVHQIDGGFLVQEKDRVQMDWENFEIRGEQASDVIRKDLEMAWKVCAHLKSNAIALVSNQKTVGLGMGQVDRVNAVELACLRMNQYHPQIKTPVVMASDGFFPFPDSIERAVKKGIKWVIQPGGSIKDKEIFKKAQELGLNMICTYRRHFKH